MSITYAYEIIKVDEASRCMEVVYSAEGHQTMHISTRLPFEGEVLENVIKAFAPVPLWVEMAKTVVAPQVGVSGVIALEPSTSLEMVVTKPGPTSPSGNIPVTEV
jgi:hypothetical protein